MNFDALSNPAKAGFGSLQVIDNEVKPEEETPRIPTGIVSQTPSGSADVEESVVVAPVEETNE